MIRWTVIVPIHLRRYSARVLQSITVQTIKPHRVIIVGNGEALSGLDPAHVLAIEAADIRIDQYAIDIAHQSHARNTGRKLALQDEDCDWLAYLDADDLYGRRWLETLEAHVAPKRILGSLPHLMVDDSGFYQIDYPISGPCEWVNGGTIAMSVGTARALTWPVCPTGEDVFLCKVGKALGYQPFDVGPGPFCYERRGSGHTWREDARAHLSAFQELTQISPREVADRLGLSQEQIQNVQQ